MRIINICIDKLCRILGDYIRRDHNACKHCKRQERQYDDNGVKTSLKLDEKAVNILRSGGHSNHRLCVIGGEKTVGVMGDTPFTIIGKRGDWTFDNNEGEVRINYTLPDISNEPMDFNIRIKFSVVQ